MYFLIYFKKQIYDKILELYSSQLDSNLQPSSPVSSNSSSDISSVKRRKRNVNGFKYAQSPIFCPRTDNPQLSEIHDLDYVNVLELMELAVNDDIELVKHNKNPTNKLLLFPQIHFKIRESMKSMNEYLNRGLLQIIMYIY